MNIFMIYLENMTCFAQHVFQLFGENLQINLSLILNKCCISIPIFLFPISCSIL